MKKVVLGSTGEVVSELCLGALHLGSNTPDEVSIQILDTYVERGGAFLDTANIYNRDAPNCSGGESERLIGQWMRDRGIRADLFVATKVGMAYPGQPEGLRAEQIERECEKSLKRLKTDVIDLYYAHADDRNTPLEETLAAFDRLVRSGKVRFIGASNFQPTRLVDSLWTSRTNGWAGYCCIQQRYSYLRPRPGASFGIQVATNDDLLDFCALNEFPLVGYAPFLKGAVASRPDIRLRSEYVGKDSDARLAKLNAAADRLGITACQLTLAWMRHHEAPVIPLIGASSVAQVNESLDALQVHLEQEHMRELDSVPG
jgi:aryl-alcohol dehydrogenase-like predicted oxidoreductase